VENLTVNTTVLTNDHWQLISELLDKANFPRSHARVAFELSVMARKAVADPAQVWQCRRSEAV
jgi:hypothetical protein